MKDQHEENKLLKLMKIIKKYPKLKKYPIPICVVIGIITIVNKTQILDRISLDVSIEWLNKLKGLIENEAITIIIILFIICVFIYKVFKLVIKSFDLHKLLDAITIILQKDSNITGITYSDGKDKKEIHILKNENNKKDTSSFPSHEHKIDSEEKQ